MSETDRNPSAQATGPGTDRWPRGLLIAMFALAVAIAGTWSMPPLDRDEARFAQASAQMLETGDFINIRFQDRERNKKPAGIYWMQAASVAAFSSVEAREIWAYRLPSILGAVLAALFTWVAGQRLVGREAAFLGTLLLCAAPLLAAEATIAKTDAMLLATICTAQAALAVIYRRTAVEGARRAGWGAPAAFWIAIAAGILLKGPIAPMISGLTIAALALRRPRISWLPALRPVTGVLILLALVGPWAAAIGIATDGRFFTDALGGDALGKIAASQESHGGPPGYHLILLPILFWPALALLPRALAGAVKARGEWGVAFLIAWIVPAWIVFEIAGTKLPHYVLPLYPALALLAGRIAADGRRALPAGAALYAVVGLALASGLALLPHTYASAGAGPRGIALAVAFGLASLCAAGLFWAGRTRAGALASAFVGAAFAWAVLSATIPHLDRLDVSRQLRAEAQAHHVTGPVALLGYYEPSAVFLLGTNTILANDNPIRAALALADGPGRGAFIEARWADDFGKALQIEGVRARAVAEVSGVNYSKGDDVSLTLYISE